ncbi:MAG: hypothetical protein J6T73_04435, partial [Clostridia bacterium]|nr:hypothetical protein [Clostridia bacterium]
MKRLLKKALGLTLAFCITLSLFICLCGVQAGAISTSMIVWNGAPAYSRLLYRPDTGKFEAGTKYVLSFDIELTDITEENEPFFWCVFYATEGGFSRIQHADFDITKTALKNGYHYDVKFTVPADCRDYNNILLKFGDTGANGYEQTMKLANLDLWSLDGSDNKVSQIELSIPATVDDIQQVTDTNQKSNGVHGAWVCPKDYLKNITVEPQNGYFDPISEPACEHANTSEVEAVASTCCTAGHAAYTVCDDCGEIISGSDEALPLDPDNHDGDTEVRDAKEATETEEGYTGDTYCLGCGEKIADGETIAATGHTVGEWLSD